MDIENAKLRIESLTKLLIKYQYHYYVLSKPLVEDMEYDLLFDELQKLENQFPELALPDSPTKKVGSDLEQDFPEYTHTIPVLSLDKVNDANSLYGWIQKTNKALDKSCSYVIEPKIDGLSIVLYYKNGMLDKGVTRGNGIVGNDVTGNIRTIKSLPLALGKDIDLVVRGEIYIRRSDFIELNSKMENIYANSRNLASGVIRRKKSSETAAFPLRIFVYDGYSETFGGINHTEIMEELIKMNFPVNTETALFTDNLFFQPIRLIKPGNNLHSQAELEAFISRITKQRESLEYDIDGLVIKLNETPLRKSLGYTGHHPKWALAYKFASPKAQSMINSITVQVGRTGKITPVAEIEPVFLAGSTVSRATLHNQDYIDALEVSIGDKVSISKRGDIIPAIESVTEKNEENNPVFHIPGTCPVCSHSLVQKGAHLFCENYFCNSRVVGRISYFAAKGQMNIETLGFSTVELLVQKGFYKSIEDIYTFDYRQLEGIEGFKEKKINNFINSVEKSKDNSFYTFLYSLGLEGIGKNAAKLLIGAGYDSFNKLFELAKTADTTAITAIKGLGEETASQIIENFSNPAVINMIHKLISLGLPNEAEKEEPVEEAVLIFSGQTWVITGTFESYKPRSKAGNIIEKQGGKVTGSVTSKTTHLLAGAAAGSKLAKAQSLGIRVVSEEEFNKMVNKN